MSPRQAMPCQLPPGHPSGTNTAYKDGCRCPDSREAATAQRREYRRAVAFGRKTVQGVVDASEATARLRHLIEVEGMGVRRLADQLDVSHSLVFRLLAAEQARIRPDTAARILAYTPEPDHHLHHGLVRPLGARRRLQALAAIGWSATAVARRATELGYPLTLSVAKRVRSTDKHNIKPFIDTAVRVVYDDLWDQAPPIGTQHERASKTRTLRIAAEHGWLPPMAWDDHGLDDPDYSPDPAAVRAAGVDSDKLSSLIELLDADCSLEEACARAGYSEDAAKRALHRAERSTLDWPHLHRLAA